VVRAVCEEYRAGDAVDIEHDWKDRESSRRITCPLFVLWVDGGFVAEFGNRVSIWKLWADDVRGRALSSGHFMMEELPEEITRLIKLFLRGNDLSMENHSIDWSDYERE
jgi:haloacetate dehalogenase